MSLCPCVPVTWNRERERERWCWCWHPQLTCWLILGLILSSQTVHTAPCLISLTRISMSINRPAIHRMVSCVLREAFQPKIPWLSFSFSSFSPWLNRASRAIWSSVWRHVWRTAIEASPKASRRSRFSSTVWRLVDWRFIWKRRKTLFRRSKSVSASLGFTHWFFSWRGVLLIDTDSGGSEGTLRFLANVVGEDGWLDWTCAWSNSLIFSWTISWVEKAWNSIPSVSHCMGSHSINKRETFDQTTWPRPASPDPGCGQWSPCLPLLCCSNLSSKSKASGLEPRWPMSSSCFGQAVLVSGRKVSEPWPKVVTAGISLPETDFPNKSTRCLTWPKHSQRKPVRY